MSSSSISNRILHYLLGSGGSSILHRWLLNLFLAHLIPFNRPHGIRIAALEEDAVIASLPYRRANCNHLRGLHACSMATAAEFASGIAIVRHLGLTSHRLIMKELRAHYKKQGRSAAVARCELTRHDIENRILRPLSGQTEVDITLTPRIYDADSNLLCEVTVTWQIKPWHAVHSRAAG